MQQMAHVMNLNQLYNNEPQLFTEKFDSAHWLFVPLCGDGHWILAAAKLKKCEIHFYNSLDGMFERDYLVPHVQTLKWLKYFLSWRLSEYLFSLINSIKK